MKACAENQKELAWLALGALEPERAEPLRAHLASCPGCHQYWEEIAALVHAHEQVADSVPVPPRNAALAEAIERRIQADAARPAIFRLPSEFAREVRQRLPLAALAAALVAAAILLWSSFRIPAPGSGEAIATAPVSPTLPAETTPPPTLGSYRVGPNRSPDALDELLTRQAIRSMSSGGTRTFNAFRRTDEER